ncbi:MAG: DUF3108 domain-containing protein, partial [Muribaculaceae bacterium]|nr:DUF3108 domain-containing protein [Muribaculaceae bacterium]
MKRFLLITLIGLLSFTNQGFVSSVFGAGIKDEKLHYVISYKWGMIHKDAGEATLSLRNQGGEYSVMLAAKTKPWADKFYQVRDTLLGSIRKTDFKALNYTKIAHENGKYGKDVISYKYNGKQATGICKRYKKNKKGEVSTSTKTLTASGPVYDMLSVFYYLREIDYASLTKGNVLKATVFSGSKAETITIRLIGKEKIKLRNKSEREAYHIQFNFTTGGKKKSSDDIDTWISTDSSHIPLYLTGSLPVGQVR